MFFFLSSAVIDVGEMARVACCITTFLGASWFNPYLVLACCCGRDCCVPLKRKKEEIAVAAAAAVASFCYSACSVWFPAVARLKACLLTFLMVKVKKRIL